MIGRFVQVVLCGLVLGSWPVGGVGAALAQEPPAALRRLPPAEPATAAESAGEPELLPVPDPSLEGLEREVADQLVETRAVLVDTLSSPDSDRAVRAEAYGELGRLYQAYELAEPAQVAYRNARVLSPSDFRWAYYHAVLLQGEGRFEEAEAAYAAALNIRPTDIAALVHLGEVYLELGRFDRSAQAAERALAIVPGQPAANALLGQALLAQGERERGVELLENALEAVPEANRLHYPLGMAYREAGDLEKAREHLGQLGKVGIRPPDPLVDELEELQRGSRVRVLRGRMAFRAGRFEDAAAEFRAAVEADPEDVAALVNLGTSLGQGGDWEGAIEQYRRALVHDPDNLTAHFNLGVILLREGSVEEAIEHDLAAVAGQPGDGEAHLELGRAYRAAGRTDDALGAFRQAVELAPFDEGARVEEAALLSDLGRYREAAERVDSAWGLMPRSVRIAQAYARLLASVPDQELRDGEKAVELARRVVEANPTAFNAETLALALAESGECTEAARWQRKVIAAEAETAPGERLARLQHTLGRYEAGPPCRPPGGP